MLLKIPGMIITILSRMTILLRVLNAQELRKMNLIHWKAMQAGLQALVLHLPASLNQ